MVLQINVIGSECQEKSEIPLNVAVAVVMITQNSYCFWKEEQKD